MIQEPSTLKKIQGYLIPYHHCDYVTNLSKEEILSRIKRRTEPEKFFRMRGWLASNKETREFEGTIGQDDFKINKITKKKNSYAPVIIGRISSSNQYTKVKISMRLSYYILIFIPVWLFIFGNFFFTSNFHFQDLSQLNFATLIPVGFIILFYTILSGSFHYHVSKVKKTIEQIIEPIDDVDNGSSGASWIIRN